MKSRLVIGFGTMLIATALAVACEGEPPKLPPGVTGLPAASASAEEETPPTAAASCTPCCPGCGGQVAAVPAAGDAGAVAVAAADAEAPSMKPTRGEIVGHVTTTPAYLSTMSIVYLEDAPKEPGRGMTARIENRQMAFTPIVQVITAGGTVTFANTDPFPHNVFSLDHERFNMGSIPQNSAAPKKFETAGEYTLLCNLHPSMVGYLVVTPSSYFGRTDGRGRFRIKDVPVGTYKISAWAPRLPVVTQTVTLDNATATSDFELHR